MAFGRYFPCEASLNGLRDKRTPDDVDSTTSGTERRFFARLADLASWRSEYFLRTSLLRSLGRGKPALSGDNWRPGILRNSHAGQGAAVVTYSSNLAYPVSNIDGSFDAVPSKWLPNFMHGASEDGAVTTSDPRSASVTDRRGTFVDNAAFRHFEDTPFAEEAMWGLGTGELAGLPNSLDLSHCYGRIYGEGLPGGRVFFSPIPSRRGMFLADDVPPDHGQGIPDAKSSRRSVCCTWIAKSDKVLKATKGLFGLVAGYSNGMLAAFAIESSSLHEHRFDHGEPTAKWVLSPGVPIIAIQIDEQLSSHRLAQGRVWAVALNALGELYYLTEIPLCNKSSGKLQDKELNRQAWKTGRSVHWTLIESTRRIPRPDPFNESRIDASYFPRLSPDTMGLTHSEMKAETHKVDLFLSCKPKYFQKICEGWDMRRTILVDFAADDGSGMGGSIFLLTRGFADGPAASVCRFTRRKAEVAPSSNQEQGLYAAGTQSLSNAPDSPEEIESCSRRTQMVYSGGKLSRKNAVRSRMPFKVDWLRTEYSFGGQKVVEISAHASDCSNLAMITMAEDPLLGMPASSNISSRAQSPLETAPRLTDVREIPGQRARFMAVGTGTGAVLVWNMREAFPTSAHTATTVHPFRTIVTESPRISCLALTSLYLVHGGNDGLVQAWDPLLSSPYPIRTLNSRFSSRARRQLVQAATSVDGTRNNYYAAGAIILDPDPTVLRGMVSLGTQLRYWSYSSSTIDQHKGNKRKSRRSERGSNVANNEQRFTHSSRGVLKGYIANEQEELRRDQVMQRKEVSRMNGRFGTNLLGPGASEEEMLAYATMLSEESYASDEIKRHGSSEDARSTSSTTTDTTHGGGVSIYPGQPNMSMHARSNKLDDSDFDPEIAQAIRLSLMEATSEPDQKPGTAAREISPLSGSERRRVEESPDKMSCDPSGASHYRGEKLNTFGQRIHTDHDKKRDEIGFDDSNSMDKPHSLEETTGTWAAVDIDRCHENDDLEIALRLSLAGQPSADGKPGKSPTRPVADLETEFPALNSPTTSPSSAAGKSSSASRNQHQTTTAGRKGKGKGKAPVN